MKAHFSLALASFPLYFKLVRPETEQFVVGFKKKEECYKNAGEIYVRKCFPLLIRICKQSVYTRRDSDREKKFLEVDPTTRVFMSQSQGQREAKNRQQTKVRNVFFLFVTHGRMHSAHPFFTAFLTVCEED